MSYTFNGSNQRVDGSVTNMPTSGAITVSVWVRSDSSPLNAVRAFSYRKTASFQVVQVSAGGKVGYGVTSSPDGTNRSLRNSNAIYDYGTWHNVVGVTSDFINLSCYVDGVNYNNDGGAYAIPTDNTLNIAFRSGGSTYCDGEIADLCVWSVALSADEISKLVKGASPLSIRPQSIRFYAPLTRNLIEYKGTALTAVNSPTVSPNPRLYKKV